MNINVSGLVNSLVLQPMALCAALVGGNVLATPPQQNFDKTIADALYDEALLQVDAGYSRVAIEMMQQVVELQPDHAGAWLDLAMLNCRIGNEAATEQLLNLVEERFKPNPQIRLIISQIQNTDCAGYARLSEEVKLTQQGVLRAEVGLGIDDNVNQGLNNSSFFFNQGSNLIELQVAPSFRPRADEFLQADFIYQNLGLSAHLQMRQNFTEDEFDVLSGFVGYQTKPYLPGLNVQLGAVAGALTLGGNLYQTTYQVNTHITPTTLQSQNFGTRLITAASRVNYPSLGGADAELFDLALENIWGQRDYSVATRVDYTFDNATKNRAGGNRNSLGYNLELLKPLDNNIDIRLGYGKRHTLGEDMFSPGFFNMRRSQVRTSYNLTVTKALGKATALKLQVRKVLNRENIELFEYDNTVVRLSLLWDLH